MRETAGSAAAPAARCRNRRPESWRLAPRQPHCEHRALARFARYYDVATHHACKLARDGEAEPGAAETLRGGFIRLAKLLKQFGLLLSRHADAGIGDGHLNPVAAVPDPARSQLDLAFLCELAGIAQ